jgi:menaquinone-dependent protoporphyrinogen oxidase
MTVLVASASKHGATHEIARAIAGVLEADGIPVVLVPLEAVETLFPYDAFVLGSAIYMGRWLRDARSFVEEHADLLATRPTWLFSSGPIGASANAGTADKFDDRWLLDTTHAREHRIFGGRLAKNDLGLRDRAITGALRVPEGDFRDWPEIGTWAAAIAAALNSQPVA